MAYQCYMHFMNTVSALGYILTILPKLKNYEEIFTLARKHLLSIGASLKDNCIGHFTRM